MMLSPRETTYLKTSLQIKPSI